MGDPLSVTASIAGLVSLGLQSAEYLYKYYSSYRGQNEDLTRIAEKLDDLLSSLQIVDDILQARKWRLDEKAILRNVEKSVTRCEDVIHELEDEANKFKKEPSNNLKKRVATAGRRAAYPFRRSTLEKLNEDVDDFRDNLSLALQALQLKDQQKTKFDIEELTFIVKKGQAHNISDGVRSWLKAPDASIDFNVASSKRHPGTGLWLVQDPAFAKWLEQDNSFMWLYGFAGCGKSVLCSTAIQYAQRHQRANAESAIAYFFFTFNDESKQDASAALRALLLQLCGQITGCEADLHKLRESYNHGLPPVPILMEHLRQAISRCRSIHILLDALDESPIDTAREMVLSTIETMREWKLTGLHLLVTSRDIPDIRDCLESETMNRDAAHVWLNNDNVQKDISEYVSHKVENDPQLRRWGNSHREKIRDYLMQHAGGVFRWVECQLGPLRKCPRSEKQLEKCLRSLPQSLDETYERILCGIGDEVKEEAQQILSLLCFASRPMSVDELIEASAVDIDGKECYDPEKRFENADDLLRVCPGLIEIYSPSFEDDDSLADESVQDFVEDEEDDKKHGRENEDEHNANSWNEGDEKQGESNKENNSVKGEDIDEPGEDDEAEKSDIKRGDNRPVRIAHFSVQEFLVSNRIKTSRAATFAMSDQQQHFRICKACLLYLLNDDFVAQSLTNQVVQQYSWASYAAKGWLHHYQQADRELVQQLSARIIGLFTVGNALYHWLRLDNPEYELFDDRYADPLKVNIFPAYYAALLGLDDILVDMLSSSDADIDTRGGKCGTALIAASSRGHEAAVQVLLDHGADVNFQAGTLGTALIAACDSGKDEVVTLLLDRGADIDVEAGSFDTALILASRSGHPNTVELLLDRGADVNMQAKSDNTALIAASCSALNSQEEVVELLLKRGADPNIPAGDHGTALSSASLLGFEGVVRLLLDGGADVNARGRLGTALQMARVYDKRPVEQLLLARGAKEIDEQDGSDEPVEDLVR